MEMYALCILVCNGFQLYSSECDGVRLAASTGTSLTTRRRVHRHAALLTAETASLDVSKVSIDAGVMSRRDGSRLCPEISARTPRTLRSQMAPLGDRLLIKPRGKEQKTKGGILLPDSAQRPGMEALVGTVVAVGEDSELEVEAGDTVLFNKYGSSDVEAPDGQVSFVQARSILAKLS